MDDKNLQYLDGPSVGDGTVVFNKIASNWSVDFDLTGVYGNNSGVLNSGYFGYYGYALSITGANVFDAIKLSAVIFDDPATPSDTYDAWVAKDVFDGNSNYWKHSLYCLGLLVPT